MCPPERSAGTATKNTGTNSTSESVGKSRTNMKHVDEVEGDASQRAFQQDQSQKGYGGEVFCNRNLNMAKISAVGFDMDYTLATYIAGTFELLAFEGARKRLVEEMGYPTELLEARTYDPNYFCRGLVVDKKRGNIIKMDRHKWVKICYHGFRELSKSERDSLYDPAVTTWSTFKEPDYAILDTLFSLPDAYLFCELVELKDKLPSEISKSYIEMYRDVRRCVDLSHRDGYIKEKVAQDPAKYIVFEPELVPTLERIRSSGRKVFLVTNSLYDYTDVVMTYLTTRMRLGDPALADVRVSPTAQTWRDLFDLIIVGSCKPGFLTDSNLSLYRVDTASGALSNTEGPLFETKEEFLADGKVFQGGNWKHLHNLLGVVSGAQLVYVGDHMYSDILRSKRELGWRTVLVIPELVHEIDVMVREAELDEEVTELQHMRDELDDLVDRLESQLYANASESEGYTSAIQEELEKVRRDLISCKVALKEKTRQYHVKFHPIWGQLFKVGYQNSRFAEQVENYACLYTSKVTNLLRISPEHNFRCMSDVMPHDRLEENPIRKMLRSRDEHSADEA